jgi:hemolysin activation/secretion protein
MLRLMPLKQIAVGGRYSVRGFRENQWVRDNGFLASLEAYLTVIRESRFAQHVPVAPLVDFGHAWNTSTPTPNPKTLACIGLGLRWAATVPAPFAVRPQFEVFWCFGGCPRATSKPQGGICETWACTSS